MPSFASPRRAPMIFAAAVALATLASVAVVEQPAAADEPVAAAAITSAATSSTAAVDPHNTPMGWKMRQDEAASGLVRAQFTPDGLLGIDVSSYQGEVNWKRWVKKGRTFAFVKATQGTSYRNPYFASQYTGSYEAGMIRGAYHFANPAGKSGSKQARYFVKHGGAWSNDAQTLPGVLDIEYNPSGATCYGLSHKKMIKWITSFTKRYKVLTTRDAIIYSTTDWWTRCTGNTTKFSASNPLWIARYGTRAPGTLPGTWTVATFWQYTSSPIDQDVFSSTKDRLTVLATGVETKKNKKK